jgi:HK97 family phage prohead protease
VSDILRDAPRDNLIRSAPFVLERSDDNGDGLTLRGHAAVFNQWTEIDSWEGRFLERIAPGAFRKTLQESGNRVKLQFDHGSHPLIGSMPIGVIRNLAEDRIGLDVDARLHDNWLIQPVRDAIADGSIDGMSFRFYVEKEKWDKVNTDMPERTITEVRLVEVGPVVYPAYAGTDVGVRSLAIARSLELLDNDTLAELRSALETFAGAPSSDTPNTGAADIGTPVVRAVVSDEPPITGHSSSYQPARRPVMSPDRRTAAVERARRNLANLTKDR